MLRVKNLDQKDFFEISDNLKKRIHTYYPEWTDENYHDPGITILEVLVWLEDMQRYYLNRVTRTNYERFFGLLGQREMKVPIAKTHLTFYNAVGEMTLPKGFKTYGGERCFETKRALNITLAEINSFMSRDEKQVYDYSYACGNSVSFYPFGKQVKEGNAFYIGLSDPLPIGQDITMYIDVVDQHSVKKNCGYVKGIGHEIQWSLLGEDNSWYPLEVVHDKSYNFAEPGVISFKSDEKQVKSNLFSQTHELYWLKGFISHKGDAVAPEIKDCIFNVVSAQNIDKKILVQEHKTMAKDQLYFDNEFLTIHGECVLHREISEGFWELVHKEDYEVVPNEMDQRICIQMKESTTGKYRLVSKEENFYDIVGSSTGLPEQDFHHDFHNVIMEGFMLAVESTDIDGQKTYYRDYKCVTDFIGLDSSQYCFQCDIEASRIRFGTDEKGNIPKQGHENIFIISYGTSDFAEGNVHVGEIDRLGIDNRVEVVNDHPAIGGRKKYGFDEKKIILQQSFKALHRAVTLLDYEVITKDIPGLRLRKIKAIENHLGENQISVIVIPYLEEDIERVDQALLDAIKRELEPYRLLGTRLDVIGPEIVSVGLELGITVEKESMFNVKLVEKSLLEKYAIEAKGNKIGKGLSKNEIFDFLSQYKEIHKINYLWIDSSNRSVAKDKSGNLMVSPNAIMRISNCKISVSK